MDKQKEGAVIAVQLERLDASATKKEIVAIVRRDGAVIVENFLPEARVEQIYTELRPFIDQTVPHKSEFGGYRTTRTGGLVAKSAAVRKLLLDERVLGTAATFLEPYTEKIQLNLTQVIRLLPGQDAQELHRDRFIWGKQLSPEIEPQLNTIWAITEFTAENGATRVVPGSHSWDWARTARPEEITQAVMPRGSVMFYSGSVIHGGGANGSDFDRVALNLTYVNAWLRQEENQYLSCPPEVAKEFAPALRDLLGYTMATAALGYYTPPRFVPGTPGALPPELALADGEDVDLSPGDFPEAKLF